MPLIRSVGPDGDGFTVVFSDGSSMSFTSADLPTPVRNGSLANAQAWFDSRTAILLNRDGIRLNATLTSIVPLVGEFVVS